MSPRIGPPKGSPVGWPVSSWSEDRIVVAIEPRAKARPRASSRGGRVHKDKRTAAWEREFACLVNDRAPRHPMEGPIRLVVAFVMPRPKRLYRKKDPEGLVWTTAKPDASNMLKAVEDALQPTWYKDDSQIVQVEAFKYYAEKGGSPRVEFWLGPADIRPELAIWMVAG